MNQQLAEDVGPALHHLRPCPDKSGVAISKRCSHPRWDLNAYDCMLEITPEPQTINQPYQNPKVIQPTINKLKNKTKRQNNNRKPTMNFASKNKLTKSK